MRIPKRGENIVAYANTFGIDVQEVWAWVDQYVNRPGELPWMIEAGVIEGAEKERATSIMGYIKSELDNSIAGRIKAEMRELREAA